LRIRPRIDFGGAHKAAGVGVNKGLDKEKITRVDLLQKRLSEDKKNTTYILGV